MASQTRTPRTLPDAYAARLRSSPGDPLVTFYDLASGERVELSATTWINWAAKVAGLLTDELDLERGSRLRLDIGAHWQASVVLGGAWWAGIAVVAPDASVSSEHVDLVVCAESDVERHLAAGVPVLASSLKPMAGPCGPLPAGALDFSREVLTMPDAYAPLDAPEPDDLALVDGSTEIDHAGLLAQRDDDRVLTDVPPGWAQGASLLGGALAGTGSLVLVNRHGQAVPPSLPEQERVSRSG